MTCWLSDKWRAPRLPGNTPGAGSPRPVPALAVLSMHTSPLEQPGTADAGGMNVYVRQLASALARSGARCEVYTRRETQAQTGVAMGRTRVSGPHHVEAGAVGPVPKEALPESRGRMDSRRLLQLGRALQTGGGRGPAPRELLVISPLPGTP